MDSMASEYDKHSNHPPHENSQLEFTEIIVRITQNIDAYIIFAEMPLS